MSRIYTKPEPCRDTYKNSNFFLNYMYDYKLEINLRDHEDLKLFRLYLIRESAFKFELLQNNVSSLIRIHSMQFFIFLLNRMKKLSFK